MANAPDTRCHDRSDYEPKLDDVTRLHGTACEDCGAPRVIGWDDYHGWADVRCPLNESGAVDPCYACDHYHATRECECGKWACAQHWDATYPICRACADGPDEPDYDTGGVMEQYRAAHELKRSLR